MSYIDSFLSETSLIENLGKSNAYLIWVMGLYLDESDLEKLTADCLTDEGDDKKIDFLRIDKESKKIILVQGTYSDKPKDQAKANKASDLNTAVSWFLNGEVNSLPEHLKENITEARKAIDDGDIDSIDIFYLHNSNESKNVSDELNVVGETTVALLKSKGLERIHVTVREIGSQTTERLFMNQSANIVVRDNVECPFQLKYEESGDKWKACVLTVSGEWLRQLYNKYSNDLFSANYRGFLGYNEHNNINDKIRETAERFQENFWSYNNGITILTNNYTPLRGKVILDGISIINGAQTTGAIASVNRSINLDKVKVLTRIIQSEDVGIIDKVIKFNNTQNQITAWDKFGNHPYQVAIESQFRSFGHTYSFKRGFENRDNPLSVENSIQQLLAFQGQYADANRSKVALFESDKLYNDAFEHVKARHILFVYVINECIENIRKQSRIEGKTSHEAGVQLMCELFAEIKSKNYVLAIVGECISELYVNLHSKKEICLTPRYSKRDDYSLEDLTAKMKPFVGILLTQISNYDRPNAVMSHYKDRDVLYKIADNVCRNINSLATISEELKKVITNTENMICNG